jgi:hypothetical protein
MLLRLFHINLKERHDDAVFIADVQ